MSSRRQETSDLIKRDTLQLQLENNDIEALTLFIGNASNKDYLKNLKKNGLKKENADEAFAPLVAVINRLWFDSALNDNLPMLNVLITLGINKNITNEENNSALMLAVVSSTSSSDILSRLLEFRDIKISYGRGRRFSSVLEMAIAQNKPGFVEIILRSLINPSDLSHDGIKKSLVYAFQNGHRPMLEVAFERFVSPDFLSVPLPHEYGNFLHKALCCKDAHHPFDALTALLSTKLPIAENRVFYEGLIDASLHQENYIAANSIKKALGDQASFPRSLHLIGLEELNDITIQRIQNLENNNIEAAVDFFFGGEFKSGSFSKACASSVSLILLPVIYLKKLFHSVEQMYFFRNKELIETPAFAAMLLKLTVLNRQTEFLKQLVLNSNFPLNAKNSLDRTALYWAIQTRNTEAVRVLIAKASLYVADEAGLKPHEIETSDEIRLLIINEMENNIDHIGEDGLTQLARATIANNAEKVTQLLANGAQVNLPLDVKKAEPTYQTSLLHLALFYSDTNIIDSLLKAGALIGSKLSLCMAHLLRDDLPRKVSIVFNSPQFQDSNNHETMMIFLHTLIPKSNSLSCSQQAIIENCCKAMLENKDSNFIIKREQMIFLFAARFGFKNLARHLLGLKSIEVLNYSDGGKKITALHWAVKRNDLAMMELLVSQPGIDLYHVTKQGIHTLMLCSSVEAMTLLLNHGYDTHFRASTGRTALTHFCITNKTEMVQTLLNHGATPDKDIERAFRNSNITLSGIHALLAFTRQTKFEINMDIYDLLIAAGAEINTPLPDSGKTILMMACRFNMFPLIELLIAKGVNAMLVDNNAKQALDYLGQNSEQGKACFNKLALYTADTNKDELLNGINESLTRYDSTLSLYEQLAAPPESTLEIQRTINELRLMKALCSLRSFFTQTEECTEKSIQSVVRLFDAVKVLDVDIEDKDKLYCSAQSEIANFFLALSYQTEEPETKKDFQSRALNYLRLAKDELQYSLILKDFLGYNFGENMTQYPIDKDELIQTLIMEVRKLKEPEPLEITASNINNKRPREESRESSNAYASCSSVFFRNSGGDLKESWTDKQMDEQPSKITRRNIECNTLS